MKKYARLLALILAIALTLLSCLSLVACFPEEEDDDDDKPGIGGNEKTSYTVSVKSIGGMPLSNVVVTVYADNTFDDLEGYATTDSNGIATLSLKPSNSYAIKITGVPEGYLVSDQYSFSGTTAAITLGSTVINNPSLSGVTYSLGSIMRDFTITNTEGKKVTLSELLKTKDAVLLNFWYTTCSWCIEEFPDMQEAYEAYSEDIAIVAVDPYVSDTMTDITLFKSDMGLTFDMGQDLAGLATAFGVTGYPTSVMIDRYGAVCLIVPGAITGVKYFNAIFEHFIGSDYQQKLLTSYSDLAPTEKPNIQMAPSDEVGAVMNGAGFDATYYPEEGTADAEYSWPFIITEKGGVPALKASNAFKDGSYSTMHVDVELSAGDALALDYFASTELGADMLYILVDGVSINTISGESDDWETCYPYVATQNGKYKVTFLYLKDSTEDVGEDTIYLKNLRKISASSVSAPTYIPRWAATGESDSGVGYDNYAEVFLGADGYYHVGSSTGPLLLANLMGYTPFSDEDSVYTLILNATTENNELAVYYDAVVKFCNYASNAKINGLCTVNEELKGYLERIAEVEGFEQGNPNTWLQFCLYYDAYGTGGAQLEDPIIGLAPHSAYEVILNPSAGLDEYPNTIVYDRVIMPRGLWSKITPTVSGVYRIASNVNKDDQTLALSGWIFLNDGSLYFENCIMERFVDDANNVNMYVYLEAGTDYYIDIAFEDVYKFDTINFKVEYIASEYEHFRAVSPGAPFTYELDANGEVTNILIAGGVKVVLGDDGYYYNVLPDGTQGASKVYVDFTMWNSIFGEKALYRLIQDGAFNFAMTEDDHLAKIFLESYTDAELRELWGDNYEANYELFRLNDVKNGVYHGNGEDLTALAESYYAQIITEGDDLNLKGCVAVNEELAGLLQKLMDKYTFKDVENSWVKLCYFYETLDENWEWIPNT